MMDTAACDKLVGELRELVAGSPEGRHAGDAITSRLFAQLFNDEDPTLGREARVYVSRRQLTPLLLELVELVVDFRVGSLHLQCTWDTVDSAIGILDNYCRSGGDQTARDLALADIVAHDVLRRALTVLVRCVHFDTRWVQRSSALESLLLLVGRLLQKGVGVCPAAAAPAVAQSLLPTLAQLLRPQENLNYKICDYVSAPCIFAFRAAVQRFGPAALPPTERPLAAEALRKKLHALLPALQVQLDCLATLGRLADDAEAVGVADQVLAVRERLLTA